MAPLFSPIGLVGFFLRHLYSCTAYSLNNLRCLIFGKAITIARSSILCLLSSIEIGTLILVDEPFGECHVFGQLRDSDDDLDVDGDGELDLDAKVNIHGLASLTNSIVTLAVSPPLFYTRLLPQADMGFAESYLLEEVTCDDLTAFFRLFIINRARLNNGSTWWSAFLGTVVSRLTRLITCLGTTPNTAEAALRNAAAHYDLGNDLFAAFFPPRHDLLVPDLAYQRQFHVDFDSHTGSHTHHLRQPFPRHSHSHPHHSQPHNRHHH